MEALEALSATGLTSAGSAVLRIAAAVEHSMDGTSGALFELFFTALAAALQTLPDDTTANIQMWAVVSRSALQRLEAMTPARVGDRTVMDALIPYIEALGRGNVEAAVEAARKGRDSTQGMEASLGRAVYVAGENWSKVPDPGAEGVVAIAEGLSGAT